MDPENEAVDQSAVVDPAAGGAQAAPQDPPQQQQDQGADGAAKPHGNAGKTPWYMQRINEETNRRVAMERDLQAAAQRAADAEALLARMANGAKPDGGQPAQQPQPRQAVAPEQYQHDVRAGAEQLRFYENTNEVKQAGFTQFGAQFGEALETLTAVGATSDEFVFDVISVDKANAHVIFDTLAKDPERAAKLVSMNPRARIAELTRMTMVNGKPPATAGQGEQQQAKPAAISRAPAPKPAVEPSAPASENDWMDANKLDNMSEAEANAMFSRQWDAKYGGRGRAA